MTRHEWLQQSRDRAARALEAFGQRLLALHESASAASHGIIPFRPVNPRLLGSVGAVAACLLLITLLSGACCAVRGLVEHLISLPAAEAAPETEYVLRCMTCGCDRRASRRELSNIDSRDGEYWCDKCRAYSAHRMQIGDTCIAIPFYDGEAP